MDFQHHRGFVSHATGKQYSINYDLHCNSKNVVYLLTCIRSTVYSMWDQQRKSSGLHFAIKNTTLKKIKHEFARSEEKTIHDLSMAGSKHNPFSAPFQHFLRIRCTKDHSICFGYLMMVLRWKQPKTFCISIYGHVAATWTLYEKIFSSISLGRKYIRQQSRTGHIQCRLPRRTSWQDGFLFCFCPRPVLYCTVPSCLIMPLSVSYRLSIDKDMPFVAKQRSPEEILEIQELEGKMPISKIREKYGIGSSKIYRIRKQKETLLQMSEYWKEQKTVSALPVSPEVQPKETLETSQRAS